MNGFKRVTGEDITDLKAYILDYLRKRPECYIMVGCDSQSKRNSIIYATTIIFITPRKGGHVIMKREWKKKGIDFHSRLWAEVENIGAVSTFLGEFLPKDLITPCVDFNPNPKWKSNSLFASAIGYLKGLGFDNVVGKPDAYASSSVADHICRT